MALHGYLRGMCELFQIWGIRKEAAKNTYFIFPKKLCSSSVTIPGTVFVIIEDYHIAFQSSHSGTLVGKVVD